MEIALAEMGRKSVAELAAVYAHEAELAGGDLCGAPARVRRRACRHVWRGWYALDDLSPAAKEKIETADDAGLLQFLKDCADTQDAYLAQRKQALTAACADFDEPVRQAFFALFESGTVEPCLCARGDELLLCVESGVGVDRTLVLRRAVCDPADLPDRRVVYLDPDALTLELDGDGFSLRGDAEPHGQDATFPFSIRFAAAGVRIISLHAAEMSFYDDPWGDLELLCMAVLNKYDVCPDCLNARETALLPLAGEIARLHWAAALPEEFATGRFPLLREKLQGAGRELLPLLDRVEANFSDDRKKSRALEKLHRRLNRKRYEPLWRELHAPLAASQDGYPVSAPLFWDESDFDEKRRAVAALLHARGYAGDYPHFVKTGKIRGLHLARSHNVSYLVGAGRRAAFHIFCTENCLYGYPEIEFHCGTQLLKKGEAPGDIYACQFDTRGRSFGGLVAYSWGEADADEASPLDLAQTVAVAAKKAELSRLTKQERRAVGEVGGGFSLTVFLLGFLVGGGLFGLGMTAVLLVGALLTLLFLGPQAIPQMLTEIPWPGIFLLAGGLFGLAFGILEAIDR